MLGDRRAVQVTRLHGGRVMLLGRVKKFPKVGAQLLLRFGANVGGVPLDRLVRPVPLCDTVKQCGPAPRGKRLLDVRLRLCGRISRQQVDKRHSNGRTKGQEEWNHVTDQGDTSPPLLPQHTHTHTSTGSRMLKHTFCHIQERVPSIHEHRDVLCSATNVLYKSRACTVAV